LNEYSYENEYPIPYGSQLDIPNITCKTNIENKSCDDYIYQTNNGCWTLSPLRFSDRNAKCSGSFCSLDSYNHYLIDSYNNFVILNITSNNSSSTDYYVVMFNFVFIGNSRKNFLQLKFNMHPFNG
ncbi:2666_t:CDS:1, partial [Scutellospora calospora]